MLARAKYSGVEKVVVIGTDPQDSLAARDFASAHDHVYWTFGVHPNDWAKWHQEDLITKTEPRLVAIGEVGLDYHYGETDKKQQIRLLNDMLTLATTLDLPVSFHVREAFADFLAVVQNFPKLRGVIHSFSDNKKTLKRLLDETDFYIGVNGMATYSTLPLAPLEKILLETDAPFLTPKPHRGVKNEPAYIKNIAEWLATTTGKSFAEVAEKTTKNATTLFALD